MNSLLDSRGRHTRQGLEILKSEIRDWDRDPDLWDAEFRLNYSGLTGDQRNPGRGPENFPWQGPGPVPTPPW